MSRDHLLAELVALVGDDSVRLVDDEHAAQRRLDHLLGAFRIADCYDLGSFRITDCYDLGSFRITDCYDLGGPGAS